MKRFLRWTAVGLLALAALVYLGDWAVWKVKVARGVGMGSITVGRVVVAPLKGGKEEYYPDGSTDVPCSRSLFPQGGGDACWWLARNPVIYER
ncbi:hypothetical protein [Granulicella pectinivorans]|uniref:hypothetical protein n=1 Tax=Granulicella pectinivorans TaxID=474950 RepID=UPI000B7F2425|nr:hypothetical protein [Granulicella pectinivorans]